jgi:hypothetical protein
VNLAMTSLKEPKGAILPLLIRLYLNKRRYHNRCKTGVNNILATEKVKSKRSKYHCPLCKRGPGRQASLLSRRIEELHRSFFKEMDRPI